MASQSISPTYFGYVNSTKDALLVIQATLNSQLLAVPRRPHDKERSCMIKSGSIFVFIEERSGIKRWTDGIAWSPSRILGKFLVYRELDKNAANDRADERYKKKRKSVSSDLSDSDFNTHQAESLISHAPTNELYTLSRSSVPNRSLVGSLVASYAFRDQGLIKKTMSLTVSTESLHNETIHLVSYYNAEDVMNGSLARPSDSSNLKELHVSNELWNAARENALGGKAPVEDEAYYLFDQGFVQQHQPMQIHSRQSSHLPHPPPPPSLQPDYAQQSIYSFPPTNRSLHQSNANAISGADFAGDYPQQQSQSHSNHRGRSSISSLENRPTKDEYSPATWANQEFHLSPGNYKNYAPVQQFPSQFVGSIPKQKFQQSPQRWAGSSENNGQNNGILPSPASSQPLNSTYVGYQNQSFGEESR